jgi:predicted ATPase
MPEETSKSPILISEIHLQNLLSFGPDAKPIPLGPLNVLIGANGSGKSNLIEAIGLMRETPSLNGKLRNVISGTQSWIWKGAAGQNLDARFDYSSASRFDSQEVHNPISEDQRFKKTVSIACKFPLKTGGDIAHRIGFSLRFGQFHVEVETVRSGTGDLQDSLFIRDDKGILTFQNGSRGNLEYSQSFLAQIKDYEAFPEFYFLQEAYPNIRIYGEFEFGRKSTIRQISEKNRLDECLEKDFSNLNAFLLRLFEDSNAKAKFLEALQNLFEGIEDIEIQMVGEFHQLRIRERENWFPASRLSDGTMRYLCLLAILLDPTPPPLICIEEPELGMHPDLILKIADLLLEASTRTQLIVTTHSDILIDAFSDYPESVLVCEKHNGNTEIKRLHADDVESFLERTKLGLLWTSGAIGGTRW